MATVFVSIKDIDYTKSKWIDTRFSLQDVDEGKRKYTESHVTGAVYWDLERDLSDMTKSEGRHPMPEKDGIDRAFQNEWTLN